ncbi:MAG: hypothetical protein MZV70_07845 [Desulfobacterales bacterium]|nr:hypothetical protein [Desulfobacterales bacterium]
MPLHVHGIGTAVPPNAISQEEAAATAAQHGCASPEQQRQLKALYRLSRVKKRHSVVLESDSSSGEARQIVLSAHARRRRPRARRPPSAWRATNAKRRLSAREAARIALAERRARAGRRHAPRHRVLHRLLGPELRPRARARARPALDRRPHARRVHGMPRRAERAARRRGIRRTAIPDACVLVCAVELCSLHYQYGWNSDSAGLERDLRRRRGRASSAAPRQARRATTGCWRAAGPRCSKTRRS